MANQNTKLPNPDLPGIRELVWMPADKLSDNPANWRRHPPRQLKSLAVSIQENGWAGALLYNEVTKRLIDGHARKQHALKAAGSGLVPVLVGQWTEEQEKRVLATLDPISAMAEADTELLRKLTTEIDKDLAKATSMVEDESREAITSLTNELKSMAEAIDYGDYPSFFPETENQQPKEPAPENPKGEMPGAFSLKSRDEIPWDAWGPGAVLDIPNLRPDSMGLIPEPITTWLGPEDTPESENYLYLWGSTAVGHVGANFIISFYVDDSRFESVWDRPETYTANLLNLGVKTIISPNFSCYDGSHKANDIWQTYRARWLSRYFQEAGLKVIPDLMLGNLVEDEVWKWRFAGLPKNAPAVSLQVQQKGERDAEFYFRQRHRQLLKVVDLLTPESLLIYHGPNLPDWFVDELPDNLHIVKCLSFMSGRSKVMKNKQYLHRGKR